MCNTPDVPDDPVLDAQCLAQELESSINDIRKRQLERSQFPDMLGDVKKFHDAAGIYSPSQPFVPSAKRIQLRRKLIQEEYRDELDLSLAILEKCIPSNENSKSDTIYRSNRSNDSTLTALQKETLTDTADAICDLIYVLLGTALELGLPIYSCWREVQRSNMDKFRVTINPTTGQPNPQFRPDGKVLKPADWTPPNLQDILFPPQPPIVDHDDTLVVDPEKYM